MNNKLRYDIKLSEINNINTLKSHSILNKYIVSDTIAVNEINLQNKILKLNGITQPNKLLKTNNSGELFWSNNENTEDLWSEGNSNEIYYNTGNVGIGTTIPSVPLEISGNTKIRGNLDVSSNIGIGTNSPAELLHIKNSSGTARTQVEGTSSAYYKSSSSSRTYGIGITDNFYRLWDYNDSTLILNVDSNSNVGIQNWSPGYELDVTGDINASGDVRNSGNPLSSDSRIKKNITDANIDEIYNKFQNVEIKQYKYTDDYLKYTGKPDNEVSGLIAQDLSAIFPDIVKTNEWTLRYKTEDGVYDASHNEITPPQFYEQNYTDFHTIDMNKLVIKMSATIIAAQNKIEALTLNNQSLTNNINTLISKITSMEISLNNLS